MNLNQAQQKAVNTIDGPVMVIAGPGTGKTEIIAQRIAKILKKTDTSPDAILALTFTESGAKAMRERLIKTIDETAYYVNIYTFHAFCSSVIQEFPDKFIISKDLAPLSELERVKIFHRILDNHQFDHIKPVNSPYFYGSSLVRAIQDLKREAINPQELKIILKKELDLLEVQKDSLSKTAYQRQLKNIHKNQDLLKVYKSYQKLLKTNSRYDFEDMINLVVEAFKTDQDLLRTYQERLHYFLVDEYQDTNSAQNQVVNLLASYWGDQANIFVVGDSDQSVFRFQGASLENIIGFTKTYPQAKIIPLEKNYRSTQLILNASFKLIQKNHLKIDNLIKSAKPKLKSQAKLKDKKINQIRLPSETIETYWVAQQAKKLIKKGIKPQEIAVLVRHNSDLPPLVDMFAKLNLSVDIEGGADVLKDPDINRFLRLLKVINTTKDNLEDLDLFTLLHYPFFNFSSLDILKLARHANQKRTSIINLLQSPDYKKLDLKHPDRFSNFLKNLTHWQQLDAQLTFPQFFEKLLQESGFLNWIMSSPDVGFKLNQLNSLFSQIKSLSQVDHQFNLDSFLKALDLMEKNHLKITTQDLDIKTNRLTLSTAHKAKGKEWAHVFIFRLIDKKWGNSQFRELIKSPQGILKNTDLSKKEKNEDERRLFYVALTRAKSHLYLSFADRYSIQGHIKEAVPSMFLSELSQKNLKNLSSKKIQSQAQKVLYKLLSPPKTKKTTIKEKDFLKNILKDFKLSPTALNTYLACPYKFKLNNLIRVPRAKQPYLAYGTAVHKALEKFYKKFIKDDKHPKKIYLLKVFESFLKKEILTQTDLQARLKQGKASLSSYYDFYKDSFQKPLVVEKFFGGYWSKPMLGDIPLSGKIDRIDWLDQADRTVKVVDYKTGSRKTKNQILGNTKDSEGDLFRQLVFYKLLTQLDHNFKPVVKKTQLDFVEPDKTTGKFKKETFTIRKFHLQKLRQTIKKVFKSIRKLKFSRTAEYRHCQRCEYQAHCWPNGLPKPRQLKLV